jgi:hypothetical protein
MKSVDVVLILTKSLTDDLDQLIQYGMTHEKEELIVRLAEYRSKVDNVYNEAKLKQGKEKKNGSDAEG